MKIQLTKANAFEIDPNKKYLVLVTNKDGVLTTTDLDEMNRELNLSFGGNIRIALLPKGSKYKVVEASNE